MSTELKPCPFCGSADCDVIVKEAKRTAQCVCLACGLTARPVKVLRHPISFAREKAVLDWNCRPNGPAGQAVVDQYIALAREVHELRICTPLEYQQKADRRLAERGITVDPLKASHDRLLEALSPLAEYNAALLREWLPLTNKTLSGYVENAHTAIQHAERLKEETV